METASHDLPPSVGFSITEMIDRGLLDDCLQLIGVHAAMRQAAVAEGSHAVRSARP